MPFLVLLLLFRHACARAEDVPPPAVRPAVFAESPAAASALAAGSDCLRRGDEDCALQRWKGRLSRGDDAGLLYALGGLYFRQNRLPQAESCYERLVRRSPRLADAWYQLGLVRAARGRYKAAADAQRLAVGQASDFGRAYCALALDLRESGQTAMGMGAVREALRLMPDYAGAWNLLGDLQQDRGRRAEAMDSYRKALRLAPVYPGAWFNLAQVLEAYGRHDEAFDAYGRAIQAKPGFGDALLARAQLSLDRDAPEAARRDFETCLKIPDWEPEAWWGLHRIDKAQGRGEEAAEDLRRYRAAQRRRDLSLAALAARGMEQPCPYEPGLPMAVGGPASESNP